MNMEKQIQYLLDRRQIEDTIILYATLVDSKQFDRLKEEVFTEDSFIDYRATGGASGNIDQTIEFLKKSMAIFKSQHMMSNIACEISEDGKTAKTRNMLHNPMTFEWEGKTQTFFCGLWYADDWVKTDKGWRIKNCIQELSYTFNSPFHKS
ncbi:MAG: nuclear transport factor 2 family protein [Oscillospiraceae bacterium]